MSEQHQRLMSHKVNNVVQSCLLLGGMTGLLALLGWVIAGWLGLVVAAAGVLLLVVGQRVSPRWVLRMYRAHRLTGAEAPGLFQMLQALTQRADLAVMPQLYYLSSAMMNAFTVGQRDDAVIAVTDGLLRRLTRRELMGVLAHEVSHIRKNDTWVMGLADVVSRLTSLFSLGGQFFLFVSLPLMLLGQYTPPWLLLLLLIFAPTLSALLQLALSRTREYDADLDAAWLTGDPVGLAAALDKLERYQQGFLERILLPGRHIPDPSLLRTHPTTAERIQRLLALTEETAAPRPALRFPAEDLSLTAPLPLVGRRPRWHMSGLWF